VCGPRAPWNPAQGRRHTLPTQAPPTAVHRTLAMYQPTGHATGARSPGRSREEPSAGGKAVEAAATRETGEVVGEVGRGGGGAGRGEGGGGKMGRGKGYTGIPSKRV